MKNRDSLDEANVVSKKSLKVTEKWTEFEEPLLTCFCKMRQAGDHIDGKLLEAALRRMIGVSEQMKDVTSDYISSWLQRWRQKHQIYLKTPRGKSLNTPDYFVWLASIKDLLINYDSL